MHTTNTNTDMNTHHTGNIQTHALMYTYTDTLKPTCLVWTGKIPRAPDAEPSRVTRSRTLSFNLLPRDDLRILSVSLAFPPAFLVASTSTPSSMTSCFFLLFLCTLCSLCSWGTTDVGWSDKCLIPWLESAWQTAPWFSREVISLSDCILIFIASPSYLFKFMDSMFSLS